MVTRNDWECFANDGYNVGNQEYIFANLLDMARLTQDMKHIVIISVIASPGHLFFHVE